MNSIRNWPIYGKKLSINCVLQKKSMFFRYLEGYKMAKFVVAGRKIYRMTISCLIYKQFENKPWLT